jgi:hypothetical protein
MLARIQDGVVAEWRDIAMDDVPLHKQALWRPVVYEGDGYQTETIVEPSQVRVVRSTPAPTQDDYARAIQAHVDAVAQGKGYANGFALAGYRSSTVPAWAAESETFLLWRDTVWIYAYTQMAAVQAQQRSQPTVAELVQELPQISWPA